MKHLYFIRHGESVMNKDRKFAGQTDTPLTELGRKQARLVANEITNYNFDVIVSSPLIRALETAQIIAKIIDYPTDKIVINDIFMEHNVGSLAGKPWDNYEEFDTRFTDMESKNDFRKRVEAGLNFLHRLPEDNVLLVGHGSFAGILREITSPTLGYAEPPNAKLTRLI